jgi:hypothetical protein
MVEINLVSLEKVILMWTIKKWAVAGCREYNNVLEARNIFTG